MKYRSKCRFAMVIAVNDEIRQIRPGEVIETNKPLDSPYLELLDKKTKKARVKKENLDKVVVPKSKSKETK